MRSHLQSAIAETVQIGCAVRLTVLGFSLIEEPKVAPSEIIGKDEDDIGLLRFSRASCGSKGQHKQDQK